jgi:hypothetical protein
MNDTNACWHVFINNSPKPLWWILLNPSDAPASITWYAEAGYIFVGASLNGASSFVCTTLPCLVSYS